MKTCSFLILALAITAHAGPRSSQNYRVPADTTDAGGKRGTSANYTNDGSVGGLAGISTVASPVQTAKAGYVGQLYEATALSVTASPTSVNETQTTQLAASQVMDDNTTLPVPAAEVAWSVVSGPLTGISGGGLATTANVYQSTPAQAQGSHAGLTGAANLTVLNVGSDDYLGYAADGLEDAWQVLYFNQPPNALAAPGADPDGDGQKNSFEHVAGLNPLDPDSRFLLRIEPVSGQPTQKRVIFSPRLADRTYTVLGNPDLAPGGWTPLVGPNTSDSGLERTVTDPNASGARKFYQVEITKP